MGFQMHSNNGPYTTGKSMEYLESTMEALVFAIIIISWKWFGTKQVLLV